jgi:ribosomal protein S18 acetylase RimI-like enzyme
MSRVRKYLHDLRTLPADAALAYRHDGMRGAWKALAARSLHRLIRTGRLIVFAHTLDGERGLRLPSGVTITTATDRDLTALATLVGQRELGRFEALLANGRCCLIAWRGNRPVGYAWVADGIGPDVTFWPFPVEFPRSAAYLWNLYVLPSERSSGIGSALAEARLRLAREQGFHEGWRMVAPSNTASLRTVQKSARGTRVVGEIRFVQVLNRTYSEFTPHRPDPVEVS